MYDFKSEENYVQRHLNTDIKILLTKYVFHILIVFDVRPLEMITKVLENAIFCQVFLLKPAQDLLRK